MRNSTWRVAFSMSAIAVLTVAACAAKVGGTAAPADAAGTATSTIAPTSSTSTTRTATTSGTTTRTTASRTSTSIPSIPTSINVTSAINDLTSALSGLQSVIPGFGELPENWPDGVTLPPGSTISFAYGSGDEAFVTFNTEASPTEAFNLMDPQFVRAGWAQVSKDVETDYVSAKYTKGNRELEFDLVRLGDSTQGGVSIGTP